MTVTLPTSTLSALEMIDRDRAKAIVMAANHMVGEAPGANQEFEVEVVRIDRNNGVILVGNCPYLRSIESMRLVMISPHRYMISLPAGTPTSSVEINLRDILEDIPPSEVRERRIISKLADIFRQARQSNSMKKEEILIVPFT